MIQGIVFDFDGTIIDSEPLWQEAEIMAFEKEGLTINANDCLITKGVPIHEAVNFWHSKLKKPQKEAALIYQEMNHALIGLLREKGELKPGIIQTLEFCKSLNLPIGIASASSMAHIKAVMDKFGLYNYFKLTYSGDFERYPKPHPGIYISSCKKLNIDPAYSIAVEDSFNGLLAAKSARMKAVALLDDGQINDTKYDFADAKIESLLNFDDQIIQQINTLF